MFLLRRHGLVCMRIPVGIVFLPRSTVACINAAEVFKMDNRHFVRTALTSEGRTCIKMNYYLNDGIKQIPVTK
jgi:hypothetical protein